jgi:glycerol-3-phosphate O-acyltransferase
MTFKSVYPHLIPNIEDWPISKLSNSRQAFIKQINTAAFDSLIAKHGEELDDLLARSIYLERMRIQMEPWKVDPSDEKKFWNSISKQFQENKREANKDDLNKALIERIIRRYSEEIVGNFKIGTFRFARKFLTAFFGRLLNAAKGKNILKFRSRKHKLYEKLIVKGPLEQVRHLSKDGTLVVLPTHFSNLDSILIGYAIDAICGLPAFSYGAGLNLFELELVAYFMNRLGAYKVDRRKKNSIYLEVLKTMSSLSMEEGVHSLFFPGGTRSRSGETEKHLKMGLLSTVIDAQRSMLQKGETKKIYIVPLVLSYHFVLEGKYLIEQHLLRTGKEKYIRMKDHGRSYSRIFRFIWQLFSSSSEIYLSFGPAMDVFGNPVDNEGISYDERGNKIDLKDYFTFEGMIDRNEQREAIYTKNLAKKVIASFHADHVVLSSQMIAFAFFHILSNQNKDTSIFDLVNIPMEDSKINLEEFSNTMQELKEVLIEMEQAGSIKLSDNIKDPVDMIIEDGLKHLGMYHVKKPIIKLDEFHLGSQDLKLVYYYSNRLDHYELGEKLLWKKNDQIEEPI